MRKLWILSELFYPDETSTSYVLSKIANKLTAKYDVHVITSSTLYQTNNIEVKPEYNLEPSIKIIKLSLFKSNKNNLFRRTFKMIILSLKISAVVLKRIVKEDKVLIVTNPAPLLVLVSIIKKLKGFHLSILVHDVFPENTIPAKIIKSDKSLIYKLLLYVFNFSYATSNNLIVLGRDMKDVFLEKLKHFSKVPNIIIIENWSDTINIRNEANLHPKIVDRHINNIITIQYAGNIGRTQGLINFFELFVGVSNTHLYFDLWGDGAIKNELINVVKQNNLNDRVSFFGSYSRSEQHKVLKSTDISLITLSEGMKGLGVPSKVYNILSAGKAILFIGDLESEVALLIKEEKVGFCFDSNDKNGIIKFMNNLRLNNLPMLNEMGLTARKLAEDKYNENIILNKYLIHL